MPARGTGRELAAPADWEEQPLLVQPERQEGCRAAPRSGLGDEALAFRARVALASLALALLLSVVLSAWQGPRAEGPPPGRSRPGPGVMMGAAEAGNIGLGPGAFVPEATSVTDTTFSETSVTTTATAFYEKPPDGVFPEIMYLVAPESEEDAKRMARMKQEAVKYLPSQHRGLRVVPAVMPDLWPRGRYDRVEYFGKMLPKKEEHLEHLEYLDAKAKTLRETRPKAHSQCTWTEKAEGGLYNHYYDAVKSANTLEACRGFCCRASECEAIRFSPTAVDGLDLQCLLYPRGAEAWSLDRPLYKDYRVHLMDKERQKALTLMDEEDSGQQDDEPVGQQDEEAWWASHQDEDLLDRPWWETRNLEAARVGPNGEHPNDNDAWPSHHCGCSLSHLTMWMDALHRGVENLIIFESDGFPSCLENQYIGGNATDFADLVAALPSAAPEGWHVILLDKGVFGAEPGAAPVAAIRLGSGDGSRTYTLLPWKGRGVAGAAAYMVSRRFLEWVPHEIQARGFVMVDAWINWHCKDKQAQNPNPVNCYSFVVQPTDEAKAQARWF